MNKKILIAALSLVIIFGVTGCKVAKLENGQDAVVTLKDGKDISVDALYQVIKDKYGINVLVDMIDETILKDKYPADDDETNSIESQIQTWVTSFGSEEELLTQAQSAFGTYTMAELREYLSLQYKRNKAVEDYAKSIVTEKEIDAYYKDTVFGDIKASHILIKANVTDTMTTEEKEAAENEAKTKAENLIKQLNEGADFAELAKANSADTGSATKGGDLGYFTYGKMVTEFENAVKALENGKYTTTPVKSTYGYHIILKVDQKEKPELSTVQDDIKEKVANQKITDDATLQVTAMVELRKEYNLDIQDSVLKDRYDLLIKQLKEQAASN